MEKLRMQLPHTEICFYLHLVVVLCFSKWKFEILATDAVAGAILTVTAHFLFSISSWLRFLFFVFFFFAAFLFWLLACLFVCLIVCFRNLFTVASSDFQLLDSKAPSPLK